MCVCVCVCVCGCVRNGPQGNYASTVFVPNIQYKNIMLELCPILEVNILLREHSHAHVYVHLQHIILCMTTLTEN